MAFSVKVQDTLPTGSVFRSAQDVTAPASGKFTCSESGGVVSCTGGTLDGAAGPDETSSPATRKIVIEVFAPTEPDTYFNVAKIDPGHEIPEADETNNIATESTNVRINGGNNFRDLVVTSIDAKDNSATDDDSPKPGEEYTYEVTGDQHRHQPGVQRQAAQRARGRGGLRLGHDRRTTSRAASPATC